VASLRPAYIAKAALITDWQEAANWIVPRMPRPSTLIDGVNNEISLAQTLKWNDLFVDHSAVRALAHRLSWVGVASMFVLLQELAPQKPEQMSGDGSGQGWRNRVCNL
jgi:hypothetical protein